MISVRPRRLSRRVFCGGPSSANLRSPGSTANVRTSALTSTAPMISSASQPLDRERHLVFDECGDLPPCDINKREPMRTARRKRVHENPRHRGQLPGVGVALAFDALPVYSIATGSGRTPAHRRMSLTRSRTASRIDRTTSWRRSSSQRPSSRTTTAPLRQNCTDSTRMGLHRLRAVTNAMTSAQDMADSWASSTATDHPRASWARRARAVQPAASCSSSRSDWTWRPLSEARGCQERRSRRCWLSSRSRRREKRPLAMASAIDRRPRSRASRPDRSWSS
jgi:hypothetical protein